MFTVADWLHTASVLGPVLALMWLTRAGSPHFPDQKGTTMARPPMRPARDDTFDSGQFGTLRYDFKSWGGVQGIIPDPSDEQIEQLMRRLREVAREFGSDTDDTDLENASAAELTAILDEDDSIRLADAQKALCEAYGELCQGSPDAATLLTLPLRVRQGFFGWLQRKLMSPEASAADTTGSPAQRTGG